MSNFPPVPSRKPVPDVPARKPVPTPDECESKGCATGPNITRWLCLSCGSTYCDVCWAEQGPHQPGKVGIDGLEHEKTNKDVYKRLKMILDPPADNRELGRLHQEDESTTWFGIEKDTNGQPVFQDYGRYAALMADTKQPNSGIRYPQLVSFVGQTGAGKSTLIKMLISLKEQRLKFHSNSPFDSPVVGSMKHDKSPTSGDVHLYADPETAFTRLPMLYADCEGLEGGEAEPAAVKLRRTMRDPDLWQTRPRVFKSRPRELAFAQENDEARNREWAVKRVYPRLLYTFSDVIVFVLRNPKVFESSALRLLLDWASTSLESSINQPTLPHAIIVLNTTDPAIDEDEWDIPNATKHLMDQIANAIYENPYFVKYADHWRHKGQRIHNTLDLIKCYYTNISVVRVPLKGRYMLTNSQIEKLHREIVLHCDASFSAKGDAHMLSTVDELNTYLQAGFDHFTTEENKPFNFIDVALKNNPIPRDFGDHILALAAKIREVTSVGDGSRFFETLGYMIASCILTDCARQRRPGKPLDLFEKFYAAACTAALEHFYDLYWPCDFVSKKGKRCVNVKSSHMSKGHQLANGKVISAGAYQSRFNPTKYSESWKVIIKRTLQRMDQEFEEERNRRSRVSDEPPTDKDVSLAYELHKMHMGLFYTSFENFSAHHFVSPTTCFSCLMEVPEHPLHQCGHILCTLCVKAYGRSHTRNSVIMEFCPLHPGQKFSKPVTIHFKPDYAGVRILTLDGGGMRGILELEVLRAVEQALGGKIPIQAFFDLIVGTSTGGLIALGLGVKQWSVDQCITEFVRLVDQAFTPREFNNIAVLEEAATVTHGSKYKTQPLRRALLASFGKEQLYGGQRTAHRVYNTRVAVTAASGTGEEAIVLANYSRHDENEPRYRFEFPHHLRIWEAASATSAAPSFFKPFTSSIGRTYLDGAVYYNNPVKVANHERKILWPDVAENPPDIILSIGTGQNGRQIQEKTQGISNNSNIRQTTPGIYKKPIDKYFRKTKEKLGEVRPSRFLPEMLKVLVNRIDNILNSELEWKQFCLDIPEGRQGRDEKSRYIRMNLDLKDDPPRMDDKARLPELQAQAVRILENEEYRNLTESIAHTLVASTFYFVKDRFWHDEKSSTWFAIGKIVCRFAGNSPESRSNVRELGDYLRLQQASGYQPYFSVKETVDDPDTQVITITERMIDDMMRRAECRFDDAIQISAPSPLHSTTIYLRMRGVRSDQSNFYPISGFPRCLMTEDTVNETRLDRRAELIKERRFGGLIVANDPRVAPADDSVSRQNSNPSVSSPGEADELHEMEGTTVVGKPEPSTHSSTITSKLSTSLFSSARKSGARVADEQQQQQQQQPKPQQKQHQSRTGSLVGQLRAEADQIANSPVPITVLDLDVDNLTDQTAAWLTMDQTDAPGPGLTPGTANGEGTQPRPDLPDFGSDDDSDGPPSYDESWVNEVH